MKRLVQILKTISFFFILTLCVDVNVLKSQALFQAMNLDFEYGEVGTIPNAWKMTNNSKSAGYKASIFLEPNTLIKKCLKLSGESVVDIGEPVFGAVYQSIDAHAFRGKKLFLNALMRLDKFADTTYAGLFIHQYYSDGTRIDLNYTDHSITNLTWENTTHVVDIDKRASKINFGVYLAGKGVAWADKLDFQVSNGSTEIPNAPSKEISDKAISNLKSFAKLTGILKYYTPTSEAMSIDWDSFLYRNVINLENSNDLHADLSKISKQIAPSSILLKANDNGEFPQVKLAANKYPNEIPYSANTWAHFGLPNESKENFYSTQLVNLYKSQKAREAAVFQVISAKEVLGKKVRFSAMMRNEVVDLASNSQLWARVDLDDKQSINVTSDHNPLISTIWKRDSVEFVVPNNATTIRLGLIFIGDGTAHFDDVKLEFTDSDGKDKGLALNSASFEELPLGPLSMTWQVAKTVIDAGYSVEIIDKFKKAEMYSGLGKKCLQIKSDMSGYIKLPEIDFRYQEDIGNSLRYSTFLVSKNDGSKSLPVAEYVDTNFIKPILLNPYDRNSKIATVISAWNVLRYFHQNKLNDKTLDSIFDVAVRKAAMDNTVEDFTATMYIILKQFNDSQARVWNSEYIPTLSLPFLMKNIDNKIIVSKASSNSGLTIGDEIKKINGIDIQDKIKEIMAHYSAANKELAITKALAELRTDIDSTEFVIEFADSSKKTKTVKLRHDTPIFDIVEYRPDIATDLGDGYIYVDMSRINDKQFKEILPQLEQAKGIIFDSRGLTTLSEYFLGFFIDESIDGLESNIPIYVYPNIESTQYRKTKSKIKALKTKLTKNIAFIADERTMGYSETILMIAQENKIAKIIGTPSAGSAGEVGVIRLAAGYNMSLAIANTFLNGKNTLGTPVIPDIEQHPTLQDIKNFEDSQIKRALEELKKKK